MTDDQSRDDRAPEDKPKKRGFFSRLFGRGKEDEAAPPPEAEDRASEDGGDAATAPEVRPDPRGPVDHDQPAEGGEEQAEPAAPQAPPEQPAAAEAEPPPPAPEEEEPQRDEAARIAADLGAAIEQAAEPAPEVLEPEAPEEPPRAPVPPAAPPADEVAARESAPDVAPTEPAPDAPAEGEAAPDEVAAQEAAAEDDRAAAVAEAEAVPAPPTDEPAARKKSWFARLREGLSRSSSKLTDGITGLFTKRRLDDDALEELEELLITADLGVSTSAKLVASLAKERFGKDITGEEIRHAFAADIAEILEPVARPLEIDRGLKPHVVLVVGVNGSGKTTTIGKLAKHYRDQGLSVMLAAGDTFRAAAVEQLKIWADRTGCPIVSRDTGADAAGLAFDAYKQAQAAGADVLLIDTAGRLQNKAGLMDELRKIVRVLKKIDESAPHSTLLVLDATVGQNAHNQVEVFKDMVNVTGLAMTKLDGTAKGGVVVALADKFGLPVHAIGVGETAEDLRPFKAEDFARGLMGV